MAAPARRVLALAVAARRRPIENALDAPADAGGGLRLGGPDRLERPRHQRCVDRRDRKFANRWEYISLQGGGPLPGVLRILPALAVRHDVALSAFGETQRIGGLDPCGGPPGVARLDGVDAFIDDPAPFA